MTVRQAPPLLRYAPEVGDALRQQRPIVALESSVLAQGLPVPANREAAVRMDVAVRTHGAIPAITAVVRGEATCGLTAEELERFLARDGVGKVSARDLGAAIATGRDGATTVAGALAICRLAGLPVFATGGIGGVHRGAPFDESADLIELARSAAIVVCAGAKSVLDLPATMERLETLGILVVGFGTDELPAFYTPHGGLRVPARADDVDDVIRLYHIERHLKRPSALVLAVPPPAHAALDAAVVEQAVAQALAEAQARGVRGSAVTPFLLASVERATEGRSLTTNVALLEQNAAVAARIAAALAGV